jgi:cell division protease FtsH
MLFSSKRIPLALFVVVSLFSGISAGNSPAHAVNPLDKVIDEGQRQLTKIRICLNSISALIKKNPAYSKKDQEKIVEHFATLDQHIIERLKSDKFINADLESAYFLLQLNNALINHINQATNTNFKDIDSFNMQDFITHATKTRTVLAPEEILKRLFSNDKKIDALTKKALGLKWYNKVARNIDNWIITPCEKYSIPQRTLTALGAGFVGSYLAWQLFHDKFKNFMIGTEIVQQTVKVENKDVQVNVRQEIPQEKINAFKKTTRAIFKNVYGELPSPTKKFDEEEYQQLALLGKLDLLCYKWTHGLTKVGQTVAGLMALSLGFEFKRNIYPNLVKYFEVAKNWLKGGSYLKEAERAAEKVDHVRFKDIFGQDSIKRYMQLIVDYLQDPETFDRLGLTPPKGILCIGDTRTGKTYTISALFGEINDMLKRTGQAGKFKLIKLDPLSIKIDGMETILRRVRANAPCIVFIDEIDLLDLQRTGENRTLSEFLTAMSDTIGSKDSKKQVIVIAATNRPETLDIALRQPGRFGKELRFEYPNYTDRYKFIKSRLQELSLNSKELDIKKIAQFTENKSYEAINMLIKNAIIKARLRNELLVQAHLDEALDEDIYHIIPNYTKDIPVEELNILAAHFAGQALVLSLLDNKINLAKVTIKQVMTELKEEVMGMHLYTDKQKEQQRFEYGRIFTHHKADSINMNTREEKFELCKMYLAGFIAEELLLGSCGYSCHAEDDKANALHLAQSIAFEGLDIAKMPKHVQKQKQDEALAILEQCKKDARKILTEHKATLQSISDALLHHKTLDYEQVAAIVSPQIP